MKKLSIFVIVAALIVCMMPFASAENETALTVTPNVEMVTHGGTVTVTVAIANNPGHASGEVQMSAPEGLTLTALKAVAPDPDADDYPAMELNVATGLISWSCSSKITGDIALFTATYTVDADADLGEYTITAAPRESNSFRSEYDPEDSTSGAVITVLSGSATVEVVDQVNVNVTKYIGNTAINCEVVGQVVTVKHDVACKVGYLVDGAYVAVAATANDDGSYSYTVPAGVTEVILVVKGDATGDGKVNAGDGAKIQAAILGRSTLSAEVAFAADTTDDGKVNAGDGAKIQAATLGKSELTW